MRALMFFLGILLAQPISAYSQSLTESLDPSSWEQDITKKIALNYLSPSITEVVEDFVNNSSKSLMCKIEVSAVKDIAFNHTNTILTVGGLLNNVAQNQLKNPSMSFEAKKELLAVLADDQKMIAEMTAKSIFQTLSEIDAYCRN